MPPAPPSLPPTQILFGSFPIARCRDPYAVIKFLAERLWPPLHVTLGLLHQHDASESQSAAAAAGEWSALGEAARPMDRICREGQGGKGGGMWIEALVASWVVLCFLRAVDLALVWCPLPASSPGFCSTTCSVVPSH